MAATWTTDERWARATLWCLDGVGEVRYLRLLEHFSSGLRAIAAGPAACAEAADAPRPVAKRWLSIWPDADGGALERALSVAGLVALAREEAAYPERLREAGGPPWLFVRGRVAALSDSLLAIVGTRSVRPDGVRLTHQVTGWCLDRGWRIVSGGALGVDAEAHRTSLRRRCPTVVVQPAGLAKPVPRRHKSLFDSICDGGGCLVSEHPPWREPKPELFVRRNRLISGLSVLTLVVRAPRHSGALITASWARRQGRDVLVVPGAPDDPTASGCLDAIRQGARIVASPQDVPMSEAARGVTAEGRDGRGQRAVERPEAPPELRSTLALLARGEASAEALSLASDRPVAALLADLSRLELLGWVERSMAGSYRLGRPNG